MSSPTAFLVGWMCGAGLMTVIIVVYYVRARKRVASIKAAIHRYQEATKTVSTAADAAYGKEP